MIFLLLYWRVYIVKNQERYFQHGRKHLYWIFGKTLRKVGWLFPSSYNKTNKLFSDKNINWNALEKVAEELSLETATLRKSLHRCLVALDSPKAKSLQFYTFFLSTLCFITLNVKRLRFCLAWEYKDQENTHRTVSCILASDIFRKIGNS